LVVCRDGPYLITSADVLRLTRRGKGGQELVDMAGTGRIISYQVLQDGKGGKLELFW